MVISFDDFYGFKCATNGFISPYIDLEDYEILSFIEKTKWVEIYEEHGPYWSIILNLPDFDRKECDCGCPNCGKCVLQKHMIYEQHGCISTESGNDYWSNLIFRCPRCGTVFKDFED